ncbi:MAG: hypothetical protein QW140_00900 [Candidatus Aenigmatarchaeota archaeon]
MKIPGSGLIIAIVSAILAVIIFQAIQSAFFSEMILNAGMGEYNLKYLSIQILNITQEYVDLGVKRNSGIELCKLKERESCYSECFRIMISDIKVNSIDLEVTDEITCEVGRAANSFGDLIKSSVFKFLPFFSS